MVGLCAAAGAALTFGAAPLATAPLADADVVDLIVDPLMSAAAAPVADTLAGLDMGSPGLGAVGSALALPPDPVAGLALPDLLAGLAIPTAALHDLSQAWIDSPLGQFLDPTVTALATGLSGHGLVDYGVAATAAGSDAGAGGSLVGDSGATSAATSPAAATIAAPAVTEATPAAAGPGATYAVSSQWDGGFVADYTITNPGTTPLDNWQLQFNLPADESITNVWNAELAHSGTHYVLTPESYNSTIAPDSSADNIGFQATDTGTYSPPTQVTLDGQQVDGGAGSTGGSGAGSTTTSGAGAGSTTTGETGGSAGNSTGGAGTSTGGSTTTGTGSSTGGAGATYAVKSQWDGGYVAGYTINNSGTTPLDNWQLQFDLPANQSITNAWNAVVTHSGTHYVLTPESYNNTIAPDGSTNVGFQATDTGAYSPPTQVTLDGQQVDGGAGSTSTGSGAGSTTGGAGAGSTTTGGGGAGSTGGSGGSTSTGDLISAQYGTTKIENSYVVQNNAYNNSAGQSIDVTSTGFSIANENGSASTDGAPLAYPSIYLGCAYSDCSPGSPLPEQLSQIQTATSSIDYTFPSNGIYDASYDIWLNPTPITNGVNQQELMIWFDHQGPIQPVGSPVGDVTIDGKDFVVWEGSNGSNNVVSYVATSPISSWNDFNVLGFIDNMETLEPVNNSWYLTSIQAGFEPWTGSDGAAVNSFTASVNGVS